MIRRRAFRLLLLLSLTSGLPVFSAKEPPRDLAAQAREALAQTSGTIRVPGLARPVTVLRDPWGIPHIYAETQDDLFFAQGFVAAQDRLWQMEMWRRAGMGELAEVLGPEAVERDRFARLLRYRGDMEAEYASYAPDARQILTSFAHGVNAFIESRRGRWPIEFQLSGIEPEPWTPEVCLSRLAAWEVMSNAGMEVFRAKLGREVGWDLTEELFGAEPPRSLRNQPGSDVRSLEGIDEKILALPAAAGAPLRFSQPNGSNNWVVDGTLSATGKPLLANDPHRALRLPSLRYLVHLVGPSWNVIGAGEPALPGVAAGHNERIGFGFTITGIDQEDLYVEETHPEDPSLYRRGDRWEPMRIERERIGVKGGEPVEVELKFTAHGPVLHEDRERRRAYALRWAGAEPGTAGYLGALSLNRARSWPEFLRALERWKVPSENLVYADVDGNIGWQVAGLAPIRKGWSGLLPVPGAAGAYEWQGFLPLRGLPGGFNPAQHFAATANHNILPPGYAHELAFDWGSPGRYLRIVEALGQPGRKHTVSDFERLQHDEVSAPARTLVRRLAEAKGVDAGLRPYVNLLAAWNASVTKDGAAPALYELWARRLPAGVFKKHFPEKIWPLVEGSLGEKTVAAFDSPSERWFGPTPEAGRDAALLAALGEAVAEAKEKLGPDPAKWRWGALHKTTFRHALGTAGAALFELPPVERGGDVHTLNVAVGPGFEAAHGASFREVLDTADWDRSTATSAPGQSGQPGSPHYGDLLPLWAEGRYFPLLYSREKVEAAATQRLILAPAR